MSTTSHVIAPIGTLRAADRCRLWDSVVDGGSARTTAFQEQQGYAQMIHRMTWADGSHHGSPPVSLGLATTYDSPRRTHHDHFTS
ncbi:hypothetical protein [Gordonia sp. 852002-10350_SCH5691597]|uniref:hypothetical protein n=1 Tax=Gordonia sp. 852002-10350_SCH5691597 TaxID=1834085 RepID=UPI000AF62027|nr:hypothetical protein [Gordonia sp. 852002-10350_SCH5691597]